MRTAGRDWYGIDLDAPAVPPPCPPALVGYLLGSDQVILDLLATASQAAMCFDGLPGVDLDGLGNDIRAVDVRIHPGQHHVRAWVTRSSQGALAPVAAPATTIQTTTGGGGAGICTVPSQAFGTEYYCDMTADPSSALVYPSGDSVTPATYPNHQLEVAVAAPGIGSNLPTIELLQVSHCHGLGLWPVGLTQNWEAL